MEDIYILFISIWSVEGLVALLLNFFGIYFLVTEKKNKIMHKLLIHLSVVEVAFISLEVVYHSRALVVFNDASSRHRWKKVLTLVITVAQFLSIAMLTFDRVLIVKLGM